MSCSYSPSCPQTLGPDWGSLWFCVSSSGLDEEGRGQAVGFSLSLVHRPVLPLSPELDTTSHVAALLCPAQPRAGLLGFESQPHHWVAKRIHVRWPRSAGPVAGLRVLLPLTPARQGLVRQAGTRDRSCFTEEETRPAEGRPVFGPHSRRPWCCGPVPWALPSLPHAGPQQVLIKFNRKPHVRGATHSFIHQRFVASSVGQAPAGVLRTVDKTDVAPARRE